MNILIISTNRHAYEAECAYGKIGGNEKAYDFMKRANQQDAAFFKKALAKTEIFRAQGDIDSVTTQFVGGNMSSPMVWFVLREIANQRVAPGE